MTLQPLAGHCNLERQGVFIKLSDEVEIDSSGKLVYGPLGVRKGGKQDAYSEYVFGSSLDSEFAGDCSTASAGSRETGNAASVARAGTLPCT